jgi:cobalamin biosynthetic protein CobC
MTIRHNKNATTLIHGGQLNKMAELYQIAIEKWLDLSTGISPTSYPIPEIPQTIWQQLPQSSEALLNAARNYYGCEHIFATSGSQAIIARLPHLFKLNIQENITKIDVWLPNIGYKEHEKSWLNAGFNIKQYQQLPSQKELTQHAIVVVINPNNPTGELYNQQTLQSLLITLESMSGWLIIDEAFMDVISPSQSIIHLTDNKHLFVLRSVGKFFGLAGIRIGFLSAHPDWLELLNQLSSPWEVNGPAQFITEQALTNNSWQLTQKNELKTLARNLENLLIKTFVKPLNNKINPDIHITGCDLFKILIHPQATELYQKFCCQGLYVRLCDEEHALRFGIPNQKQYKKLEKLFTQHCHS